MATETCPPCTHNCRQGRDCPARKKTMPAPTDLAAALLRDVPRYSLNMLAIEMFETPHGGWVKLPDVEAALSTALEPAIAERAGEVLEALLHEERIATSAEAVDFRNTADLITALLAQNAALRAERDEALEWLSASQGYIADAVFALDKQEKAEARAERLEAALEKIAAEASVPVRTKKKKGGIKHKWMYRAWRKIATERIDIARAALKGADHE